MKKSLTALFGVAVASVFLFTALAEQPGDKDKGPGKKGPPPDKKGWEPGKVIPPFIRDALDLTESQQKKIDELEKDVRAKLLKILTEEQLQRARDIKGPKGPPKDKDGDGPPDKKGKKGKDGPPKDGQAKTDDRGAIQWYATWESGRREALGTGRPIMLVSAAPHCAGVSGTW